MREEERHNTYHLRIAGGYFNLREGSDKLLVDQFVEKHVVFELVPAGVVEEENDKIVAGVDEVLEVGTGQVRVPVSPHQEEVVAEVAEEGLGKYSGVEDIPAEDQQVGEEDHPPGVVQVVVRGGLRHQLKEQLDLGEKIGGVGQLSGGVFLFEFFQHVLQLAERKGGRLGLGRACHI
jgi:hypothetical protein